MPRTRTTAPGPSGVLRLTQVRDKACPDHGLAIDSDVDPAALKQICAAGFVADLIWEAPDGLTAEHNQVFAAAMVAYQARNITLADQRWQELRAVWSHAWAANLRALELMQQSGITKFAPFKPQRWVIASFEHHCGPHGIQRPHVHNIVVTRLIRRTRDSESAGRPE